MYYGYVTNATVAAGGNFVFTTKYKTNTNLTYNSTTGVFTVNTPGVYEIHFDMSGNTTGTSGSLIPTLAVNGVNSAYALAASASSATTDIENLAFNSILRVAVGTGTTTLTIVNKGVGAQVIASNLIIERVA